VASKFQKEKQTHIKKFKKQGYRVKKASYEKFQASLGLYNRSEMKNASDGII